MKNVHWGITQGQVAANGSLLDPTPAPHGRFTVQFELENDEGLVLPVGEAGAAAIYTSRGTLWVPIRKCFSMVYVAELHHDAYGCPRSARIDFER